MKIEKKHNITYVINEEKGIVTCILSNCRNEFMNKFDKLTDRQFLFSKWIEKEFDRVQCKYVGIAYCAADDKFDASTGKKIALNRAIYKRSMAFSKAYDALRESLKQYADSLFIESCNLIECANSKELDNNQYFV